MTETETVGLQQIGMLLALAAARDQRTVGDADVFAWHADLNKARITYDDAADAITQFYAVDLPGITRENRFRVTATDVIDLAKKARATRLEHFAYEPPAGDRERDPKFIERLRGQLQAVASGAEPAPTVELLLTGGPHPAIAGWSQGIGRHIPAEKEEETFVRRPGSLGIECPTCKALIGRPCKTPGKAKRGPHEARRAAAGVPGASAPLPPEQAAAETERRRIASRTLLELNRQGRKA